MDRHVGTIVMGDFHVELGHQQETPKNASKGFHYAMSNSKGMPLEGEEDSGFSTAAEAAAAAAE